MACVSLRSLYILNIQSVLRCLLEFFSSNDRIPQVRGWPATPSWRWFPSSHPFVWCFRVLVPTRNCERFCPGPFSLVGKIDKKAQKIAKKLNPPPGLEALCWVQCAGWRDVWKLWNCGGKFFKGRRTVSHMEQFLFQDKLHLGPFWSDRATESIPRATIGDGILLLFNQHGDPIHIQPTLVKIMIAYIIYWYRVALADMKKLWLSENPKKTIFSDSNLWAAPILWIKDNDCFHYPGVLWGLATGIFGTLDSWWSLSCLVFPA